MTPPCHSARSHRHAPSPPSTPTLCCPPKETPSPLGFAATPRPAPTTTGPLHLGGPAGAPRGLCGWLLCSGLHTRYRGHTSLLTERTALAAGWCTGIGWSPPLASRVRSRGHSWVCFVGCASTAHPLLCHFSGWDLQEDRRTLGSPGQSGPRAEFRPPGAGLGTVKSSLFLRVARQGALLCRRNPVPPSRLVGLPGLRDVQRRPARGLTRGSPAQRP